MTLDPRLLKICRNCRFFRPLEYDDGNLVGECRRYPPQVDGMGGRDRETEDYYLCSHFPVLVEDSWCGEFKKRKPGDNAMMLCVERVLDKTSEELQSKRE